MTPATLDYATPRRPGDPDGPRREVRLAAAAIDGLAVVLLFLLGAGPIEAMLEPPPGRRVDRHPLADKEIWTSVWGVACLAVPEWLAGVGVGGWLVRARLAVGDGQGAPRLSRRAVRGAVKHAPLVLGLACVAGYPLLGAVESAAVDRAYDSAVGWGYPAACVAWLTAAIAVPIATGRPLWDRVSGTRKVRRPATE